jgi:glucan phosphoethanolaminetransferase (alkaline phosphatase superfamily)
VRWGLLALDVVLFATDFTFEIKDGYETPQHQQSGFVVFVNKTAEIINLTVLVFFLLGYFIQVALTCLWFKHEPRITKKLLKFNVVLILQVVVMLFEFLSHFTVNPYLAYQIQLNFTPFLDLLIPCWYILRTHRYCFEANRKQFELTNVHLSS